MEPSSPAGGRNILIALDYTDESVRTVKWALGQHVREGDRVTLLHVEPEHVPAAHSLPGPGPFAALYEREQEQRRLRRMQEKQVERRIHSWADHYCPQGVKISWETAQVAPASVVLSGDSAAARECILTEANTRKADCLIVGSHRPAEAPMSAPISIGNMSTKAALGLRHYALGSSPPTSEYCAQHAHCPVIVVPPDAPAAVSTSCAVAAVANPNNTVHSAFLDSLAL